MSNNKFDLNSLLNDILKLQENFINNLKNENDKNQFIDNSFKPILLNYVYFKSYDFFQIDLDDNVVKVLIDLFEKLYEKFISFFIQTVSFQSVIENKLNLFILEMVSELSMIMNYLTFSSIKFCNKLIENNGLEILFKYLTNEHLLNNYFNSSKTPSLKNFGKLDESLRSIIGSLVCLGRAYSSNKNEWKKNNSVKNFLNYLNKTKTILDNKIYCCLAIAFVADDEDIESLPELKDIIPDITKMISTASKMIKDDTNLKRIELQLDENSNDLKQVCCVNHMGTDWSLINLLKALYHLSVNDKLKYEIYYKNSMNKYLRSIIYNGNDVEIEYCLMLLWQLCFDKQISNDVVSDSIFYDYLKSLSSQTDKKLVSDNASGIIWLLNKNSNSEQELLKKNEKNVDVKPREALNVDKINQKHIMISYNRDSRDLCLRIKSELEKDGYKIWIDVEDIHGSSLDSMANAIENSVCVLMCMTEKYKQSANCRAEAEYSFQLNKPIIPLIMQKDYKPDGWLGIILGSKIFVHFMKYDFEECIRRLKAEIQAVYRDNKIKVEIIEMWKPESNQNKNELAQQSTTNNQQLSKTPVTNKNEFKALNWSEKQVYDWLKENNINPTIINSIVPCDGKLLNELILIKKETPEFFYKSLAKSKDSYKKISIKDIAQFTSELKKLF